MFEKVKLHTPSEITLVASTDQRVCGSLTLVPALSKTSIVYTATEKITDFSCFRTFGAPDDLNISPDEDGNFPDTAVIKINPDFIPHISSKPSTNEIVPSESSHTEKKEEEKGMNEGGKKEGVPDLKIDDKNNISKKKEGKEERIKELTKVMSKQKNDKSAEVVDGIQRKSKNDEKEINEGKKEKELVKNVGNGLEKEELNGNDSKKEEQKQETTEKSHVDNDAKGEKDEKEIVVKHDDKINEEGNVIENKGKNEKNEHFKKEEASQEIKKVIREKIEENNDDLRTTGNNIEKVSEEEKNAGLEKEPKIGETYIEKEEKTVSETKTDNIPVIQSQTEHTQSDLTTEVVPDAKSSQVEKSEVKNHIPKEQNPVAQKPSFEIPETLTIAISQSNDKLVFKLDRTVFENISEHAPYFTATIRYVITEANGTQKTAEYQAQFSIIQKGLDAVIAIPEPKVISTSEQFPPFSAKISTFEALDGKHFTFVKEYVKSESDVSASKISLSKLRGLKKAISEKPGMRG